MRNLLPNGWSRRGDELFYRNGRRFFSVPAANGVLTRIGRPHLIFEGDYVLTSMTPGAPSFDVTPDGSRFIMLTNAGEAPRPSRLDVVIGWTREIARRLSPTAR